MNSQAVGHDNLFEANLFVCPKRITRDRQKRLSL